ncbi:MAG: TatD family hydrolase [Candidatus Bathyarchaeota archaeon]|nr:TatD family hydrolase [Candidatus Bathyarchaeum tardum]
MKFVDAHIHLADNAYSQNVNQIIDEAKRVDVVALVANSTDLETSIRNIKLAEEYPNQVYATAGIHPWNTKQLKPNELKETVELIVENKQKLLAVGEIGLDATYSGKGEPTKIQMQVFQEMLSIAEKIELPVIIHSRGATSQIVNMLPSFKIDKVILHWFSQPHVLISTIVDRGYYITEGPATIFSGGIKTVIRETPLTNLITETDGPVRFRAKPFNGELTTPSCIPTIVEAIAELKKMNKTEVANQIYENFVNFFGVKGVRDKRHDAGTIDNIKESKQTK